MSQSHFLIDQLARCHDDHVRWLTNEMAGQIEAAEVGEILGEAYERALSALVGAPAGAQAEIDEHKALAWFRSVALNVAAERVNAGSRPGRGRGVATATPHRVRSAAPPAASDGVEQAVGAALSTLKREQRQVLKLCYGDKLSVSAITFLEGLNRSQWSSRHGRAIKSFTKALTDDSSALKCRDGESLIKRDDDWLDGDSGFSRHRKQCAACGGFDASLRKSLAAMPLPIAIAAWKFDALAYFAPAQEPAAAGPVPSPDATATHFAATSVKAALASKAALFALTGVLATAGIGTGVATLGGNPMPEPTRAGEQQVKKRPATSKGTKLADHGTARMTPVQAARRRAQARARLKEELRAQP